MHTLVVYESMFGNTHAVAEAIAQGLQSASDVRVIPVGDATDALVAWADVVIVGGPTHIHGMTRATSRKNAAERADAPDGLLTMDPSADGPGVRDWLESLGKVHDKRAAAFDTRSTGPAFLTGAASGGIAAKLRGHGFHGHRQARELPGRQEQPPRRRRSRAGRVVGRRSRNRARAGEVARAAIRSVAAAADFVRTD